MSIQSQEKIWEELHTRLKEKLGIPAYESWIKTVRLVSLSSSELTMSTNSKIGKEWIHKNYTNLIKGVLKEITNEDILVKINVEKFETAELAEKQETIEEKKESVYPNKNIPLTENQIDALKSISNNLNLKYTFETFVIGSNNKFAHAAAEAVARAPGKAHNPLFIYGGVGLGKTHLMQAIGHHILAKHPGLKIKYTSTEMFTNELINSIRTDKMPAFRSKYRQMDVLLLDDIQFIEGKENTQEEIFHTFNTLYESGKQIILTSDRHPKNISTLTERLRSRFEWGLLADIQVPDIETRIAILKNKVERDGFDVPDNVLELIATAYQNNIRELEGALNRVIAYCSINDLAINTETVKNIIEISGNGNNLTIDRIIDETASYFALEPSDIKGNSRTKDVSKARQTAIYLARDMLNASFPTIGEAFGGRKHTTILYAFEKVREELQANKNLAETISIISKKITSGN